MRIEIKLLPFSTIAILFWFCRTWDKKNFYFKILRVDVNFKLLIIGICFRFFLGTNWMKHHNLNLQRALEWKKGEHDEESWHMCCFWYWNLKMYHLQFSSAQVAIIAFSGKDQRRKEGRWGLLLSWGESIKSLRCVHRHNGCAYNNLGCAYSLSLKNNHQDFKYFICWIRFYFFKYEIKYEILYVNVFRCKQSWYIIIN